MDQSSSTSSMLISEHNESRSIAYPLSSPSFPKLYSFGFFFDYGVDWVLFCNVLISYYINIWEWFSDPVSIRLPLIIDKAPEKEINYFLNLWRSYFQWKLISPSRERTPTATRLTSAQTMESKTETNRSRSSSSSSTTTSTVPRPSQPDLFRSRHLKTYSDYHCYCYLATVTWLLLLLLATVSWVFVTLIALGNQNFKKSSSCDIHVLKNNGLDLIQSLLCALTQTRFVSRTSLARVVCSSPLRERRRSSECVLSYGGIELIGKNWWRQYKLCSYFVILILKNGCKVSDFLNRLCQYIK